MSTTDLCFAVLVGNTEYVKEILCKGVDVNACHGLGGTALHVAASAGRRCIAKILIKHGANIDMRDGKGRTPLHLAATYAHTRTTKALLAAKATIDLQETLHGATPLHVAAMHECPDVLQLLIDHKADLNILDPKGRRPLHAAVEKGYKASTDTLLRAGASQIVFQRDENELTALGTAVYHGRIGMVVHLCNHELVDVNTKFTLNATRTALTMACALDADDALERVKALLNCDRLNIDESMNCCGVERTTALTVAVDTGRLALTKLLLQHGADANHVYDINLIPLTVTAAARGNPKILRALIAAGADVNSRDAEGTSALDAAICYRKPACENVLRIELSKQTPLVVEGDEAVRLAAAERRREEMLAREEQGRILAEKRAQEEREERHRKALATKADAKRAAERKPASPAPPPTPAPSMSTSPPPPPPPPPRPPPPPKPRPATKPKLRRGPVCMMPIEHQLPNLSLTLGDFFNDVGSSTVPPNVNPTKAAWAPAPAPLSPKPQQPPQSPPQPSPPESPKLTRDDLRIVHVIIDGCNVCRSVGFSDPDYVGDAREEFMKMRESVRGKPLFARAAVTMIRHFLEINNDTVIYRPLLMLPEFYVHGGTKQNLFAFNHKMLQEPWMADHLTLLPSHIDDDRFLLKHAQNEEKRGREVFMVSLDSFKDHVSSGNVSEEFLRGRIIRFAWVGGSELIMCAPDEVDLPGL